MEERIVHYELSNFNCYDKSIRRVSDKYLGYLVGN